jgi:hypothetical protein
MQCCERQLVGLGKPNAARAEAPNRHGEALARHHHPRGDAGAIEIRGLEHPIRDRACEHDDRVRASGQRIGRDQQTAHSDDQCHQAGAEDDAEDREDGAHGGEVSVAARAMSKGGAGAPPAPTFSLVQHAGFPGVLHRLLPPVETQALEDVVHVVLDRLLLDVEARRDLLVGEPFGDEAQDLELPRRQLDVLRLIGRAAGRGQRRETREEARRDLRRDPRLAPGDESHDVTELLDGCILAHVPGGAGLDHLRDRLGELLDAEYDDADLRKTSV